MGIPRIIAETDLVAVAPHIVAAMYLPDYDIKQYWHRKFHHHPRLAWLRSLLQREYSRSYVADLMASLGSDGVETAPGHR